MSARTFDLISQHDDPLFSRVHHREWSWECPCGARGRGVGPRPSVTAERAHRDHFAEVVDAEIERRVAQALRFAAEEIERELICCPGEDAEDAAPGHGICQWGLGARRIVLDVLAAKRPIPDDWSPG